MVQPFIPFNKPYMTGKELYYIAQAHFANHLAGDGPFTQKCHQWIEETTGCSKALLTHSCTAAQDMFSLIVNLQPGDEVIMPSYTFVSTANAVVLQGAVPVFVDIREDTLNIDEKLIEEAITPRTKGIAPVHYAGVSCEMDTILDIARRHNLYVLEDAAQGVMSTYKGRALGSIGHLGAYSFHETKNVISGEGGALLVNDPEAVQRAEIIREKGTDRSQFFRNEIDKYTWQDVGSSYLPGEVVAAFLWAQLEEAEAITKQRLSIWDTYHTLLAPLEEQGYLRRPIVPKECQHNAHMYYVLLQNANRDEVLTRLKAAGIYAVFHYVPLHSSPAGKRYGRYHGDLSFSIEQSNSLIRLPLWIGLSAIEQNYIVDTLHTILTQ